MMTAEAVPSTTTVGRSGFNRGLEPFAPTAAKLPVAADVAAENAAWIRDLSCRDVAGDEARGRLFDLLLRTSRIEARRRSPYSLLAGPELDDLAHQAAADALLLIIDKIDTFRGDCRFTTWAYRFAVLIVASKIRRHPWQRRDRPVQVEEWMDPPGRSGDEPEVDFEARELGSVIQRVVMTKLTARQREVLIGSAMEEASADDLAERLGSNRNAIYKTLFDARHKVRLALRAEGFAVPARR
jgi:RNA polymerase sigma-70 factor (ECF subfamily)